jgi:polyhydroxyalkanoate synthesis repressor PhaR
MTEPLGANHAEPVPAETPVVVKKYANRRLYNTESSSYITLDNLADMVRAGRDFVVYDARSGEDITRGVLTQIIVEEENKGRAVLPTAFLRQLIGFYGDSLGGMVPRYVEQTMSAIARQQAQVREAMQQTMGNLLPPGLEEMRRQNVAMMERAMSLFSPFYRPGEGETQSGDAGEELRALRQEVAELRSQLASKQTGTGH